MAPQDKAALTIQEFCELYGISVPTFYRLDKLGKAPASYTVGRKRVVSRHAAEQWQRDAEARGAA